MTTFMPDPGVTSDRTRINAEPFFAHGVNVRWRASDGLGETVGFTAQMRYLGGGHMQLNGDAAFRSVITAPCSLPGLEGAQIIAGSSSDIYVITYDPNSLPSPGTRWQKNNITPAGFETIPDTLPSPPTGAVEVPPNVAFVPLDDLVVILKANDPSLTPFVWERDPATDATALASAPKGAVGAAVVQRILVLLGAQSVGETGQSDPALPPLAEFPNRLLTVRWSNQFDFDDWNQSDVTLAGELQLDRGARIVGGGAVRQGVAVWSDEHLVILTYSTDIDVVFAPTVVDGSTGLLANQAWCETEGKIWYVDSSRRLMVYDGGQPRPIPNPNKLTSIEPLSPEQSARVQLFAYPEFDEVVISYPALNPDDPDHQLAYNYGLSCWYPWQFSRTAWMRRKGGVDAVSIDRQNFVYFQDIDSGIVDPYLLPPSYLPPGGDGALPSGTVAPAAADVEPFSFALFTNPMLMGEPTSQSGRSTRIHWDRIATPATGLSQPDQLEIHAVGYGVAQIEDADLKSNVVTVETGDLSADVRIAGKAIQLGIVGEEIKTQLRFGAITMTAASGGTR